MTAIRRCIEADLPDVLSIINAGANAYRGVIPAEHWHEPYVSLAHLQREVADGVAFVGFEHDGSLLGVMGIQPAHDVDLIRHAYVLPEHQRSGIGAALLTHLQSLSARRILVGTWAAATWAIAFYERHGFVVAPDAVAMHLLSRYWSIPKRQAAASVVLEKPPLDPATPRQSPGTRKR